MSDEQFIEETNDRARIWVQFAPNSIRKWSHLPFEGGTEYVMASKEVSVASLMGYEAGTLDMEAAITALHDAINAPKGVVPTSAERFYRPALIKTRPLE